MCVLETSMPQSRIVLWKDGKYLGGAYLGRNTNGGAYVHAQEVADKAGAISFCTKLAAVSFADALKAAHCGPWQAVEVSRDA